MAQLKVVEEDLNPLEVIREEGAGKVAIGALLLSLASVLLLLAILLPGPGPR